MTQQKVMAGLGQGAAFIVLVNGVANGPSEVRRRNNIPRACCRNTSGPPRRASGCLRSRRRHRPQTQSPPWREGCPPQLQQRLSIDRETQMSIYASAGALGGFEEGDTEGRVVWGIKRDPRGRL